MVQCKPLKTTRLRCELKGRRIISLYLFWILNNIIQFSGVYTETFHAVFIWSRFQIRFHVVPVMETFWCKGKANGRSNDLVKASDLRNSNPCSNGYCSLDVTFMRSTLLA